MTKAEVVGEGNPFRVRVTMSPDQATHQIAHDAAIRRLPHGVWILEEYRLDGSGENVVATCHYRNINVTGSGPVEVLVIGNEFEVQITRIPKAAT